MRTKTPKVWAKGLRHLLTWKCLLGPHLRLTKSDWNHFFMLYWQCGPWPWVFIHHYHSTMSQVSEFSVPLCTSNHYMRRTGLCHQQRLSHTANKYIIDSKMFWMVLRRYDSWSRLTMKTFLPHMCIEYRRVQIYINSYIIKFMKTCQPWRVTQAQSTEYIWILSNHVCRCGGLHIAKPHCIESPQSQG